jgi:hypothetical protein
MLSLPLGDETDSGTLQHQILMAEIRWSQKERGGIEATLGENALKWGR